MRIGIWKPIHATTSVTIYTNHIVAYLQKQAHEIIFFGKEDAIPDVDVIWDPTCTGARYPNRKILQTSIPWIVTLHGAANLSMDLKYTFGNSLIQQIKGILINTKRRLMWMLYKHKVAQIITVSNFAKEELIQELHLLPHQIAVIYHGYDDDHFYPQSGAKSYFLHVSSYQPIKNIERLIDAYQQIEDKNKLPLQVICPNFPDSAMPSLDEKIQIINTPVEHKRIAKYMKEAYAFVFPSFRESFGMPLLEAMACGVPIITSNSTACKEITKNAALLVNPESVAEIKKAIESLMYHPELYQESVKKSKETAALYSWEKSGFLHQEIFLRHLS